MLAPNSMPKHDLAYALMWPSSRQISLRIAAAIEAWAPDRVAWDGAERNTGKGRGRGSCIAGNAMGLLLGGRCVPCH